MWGLLPLVSNTRLWSALIETNVRMWHLFNVPLIAHFINWESKPSLYFSSFWTKSPTFKEQSLFVLGCIFWNLQWRSLKMISRVIKKICPKSSHYESLTLVKMKSSEKHTKPSLSKIININPFKASEVTWDIHLWINGSHQQVLAGI